MLADILVWSPVEDEYKIFKDTLVIQFSDLQEEQLRVLLNAMELAIELPQLF